MMYKAPTVQKPGLEDIQQIAEDLKLKIPRDELPVYHDIVSGILAKTYPVLEKYVEPVLPVKYRRTPGYRPEADENPYNAWYYKTDIKGAASGPLKGLRVAIKDSVPVAGVPMMNGSRVLEGYVPDYDPTIITRILDAGATIVGKAVCEDFCYAGSSFTSHPAPVLNPHDTTRGCGGSSSGAAVLVQTGEADIAVAGDDGGSIRLPACWTGVVGFKPTYGLIPYTGIPGMSPAVDHMGVLASTVSKCALLTQVMAGDDGLDMRQRNTLSVDQVPKYSQLLSTDMTGKKIGLVKEGFAGSEPDVAEMVTAAARSLQEKGATVEEVSIPMHTDGEAIWFPTFNEGSYHSMIVSQGFNVGPPSYYATSAIDNCFAALNSRSRDIPETVRLVEILSKYVHDNYGMRYYAKSQNLTRLLKQKYDEVLNKFDVLVMPTIKNKATKLPLTGASFIERLQVAQGNIANTCQSNSTGHPALSINTGYSEGLPVGMMIVGKLMDEQTVLNVAYAYEQIRDAEQ